MSLWHGACKSVLRPRAIRKMSTATQTALVVTSQRKAKWQPTLLPGVRSGELGHVPHDPLLSQRVRYDSRGNKITTGGGHTGTNERQAQPKSLTTPAVVYSLVTVTGQLVAVGRESDIEALFDLMVEEYGELEIVPCQ